MQDGHYAILLLAAALAVLVVEVFVPSGGLLALVTLGTLGASIFFAWREWWGTDPAAFAIYVGSVVILLPGTLVGAFTLMSRTNWGRGMLQEPPSLDEVDSYTEEQAELRALVGKRGETLTMLAPGGMVRVGTARVHSETRGMMLDPGQPVEVVAVKGNRVVVRLADAPLAPEPLLGEEPGDEPVVRDARTAGGADVPTDPVLDPPPDADPPADDPSRPDRGKGHVDRVDFEF